jgi:hypothetical protein
VRVPELAIERLRPVEVDPRVRACCLSLWGKETRSRRIGGGLARIRGSPVSSEDPDLLVADRPGGTIERAGPASMDGCSPRIAPRVRRLAGGRRDREFRSPLGPRSLMTAASLRQRRWDCPGDRAGPHRSVRGGRRRLDPRSVERASAPAGRPPDPGGLPPGSERGSGKRTA